MLVSILSQAVLGIANGQSGADILTGGASRKKMIPLWAMDPRTMSMFEMAVAILVTAFLIIYFIGTYQNLSLARAIGTTFCKLLSEQFVRFGNEDGKKLVKDGQSYYWFYASGRKNTSGITILMDLAKRMDMFSYTSSFMANPQRDRIIMWLPITDDVAMDPMSLFLVRKKDIPRLRNVEEGIALEAAEALAAEVSEVSGLPSAFIAMTEHPDIVTTLLPEKLREIITEHARHIVSIHVTDQGAKWEPQCQLSKKLVRVEFTLPLLGNAHEGILRDMSYLALRILDLACESKLPAAAKKRAIDLRKRAVQEVEKKLQRARAEVLAAKKLEKKKEEEEAVSKMSREKQIKYEEKKRKKEFNARMRKATRK